MVMLLSLVGVDKLNYIREAEQRLRYYSDLYKSIQNIDKQLARLISKSGPQMIKAIQVDERGVKAGQHDDTLNTLLELQKLTETKNNTLKALEEINEILDDISKEPGCQYYGLVLRKFYVEREQVQDIADEIGYSSRQTVYDIKNKAIRKFAVRLFGLDALEII